MKKVLSILLVVISICILIPGSVYANGGVKVFIDGAEVPFNYSTGYPFVYEGRTLVPLRATMESFGATVDWEGSTQTAIVRKDTTTVRCRIGENCIYRNNVKIINDAAAVIADGRTYLPIRAVLEAFGATVGWDGNVVVTRPSSDYIINSIEYGAAATTNYWGVWNDALAQKAAGNYQVAIDKICSISSVFIRENAPASNAMLYKHLGECYSFLKDYSKASTCFKREAYYWSLDPSMGESVIDANRRSNLIKSSAQIYAQTSDINMGGRIYFGEPYEPAGGVILGAYAEGDTNIHNPYSPNMFYMDTYPQLIGRDAGAYLLYLPYGTDINHYRTHIDKAKAKNKILQIALEPNQGLAAVNQYDGYLETLARNMQNSGCKMILRFAGEMNDTTSLWYTTDTEFYKEKFRIVADIFHRVAPSVPVVWAPNFYPAETMAAYYPGDEYVDYVGISSYKMHQPITDPFGAGVDRSRWSNQLDTIYSLYGHKKPIVICEGGASYMDYDTYADITPFASAQIKDFFTYLPIKYPNVKMAFIFDSDRDRQKFSLSNNWSYLAAYKEGITSDLYVASDYAPYGYDYYELGNNVELKAAPTVLCSYVVTPLNDTAYVNYYVNDVFLATSYGAPYSVWADFTGYQGQKTKITTRAYDGNHMLINEYSVYVNIR